LILWFGDNFLLISTVTINILNTLKNEDFPPQAAEDTLAVSVQEFK